MATGRTYDVVVLGATGFTGQKIAEEMIESKFQGSWAVAGRSRSKLENVVERLDLTSASVRPDIVLADVGDAPSLLALACSTRVLISAVGPFRRYGTPVVKACIEGKCDYLDVCGEPEFMERIELEYGEAAETAGVLITSALGFDCVPADVGTQSAASLFKPPARCTWVESFVSIHAGEAGLGGNFATYESAVFGYAHAQSLSRLRKQAAAAKGKVDLKIPGPRPRQSAKPVWDARLRRWTLPFPAADASVVKRTWAGLAKQGEAAAHTSVSFTLADRWTVALYVFFGTIFSFLANRAWGRTLLLRFPSLFSYGVFSREGPTDRQIHDTRFEYLHIAHGHADPAAAAAGAPPDEHRSVRIVGPEPGYIACSIFVTQAANVLLEERDAIGARGGVLTPGLLLRGTSYLDRIRARGIRVEEVPTPSA
uniref:Saccharopine dehydrogenase NADP binding domain-containing protein n=1 Tax=Auxenochlorella protothecoides TaxID=3075 RepID=A0A1D2AGE7_AUXPR